MTTNNKSQNMEILGFRRTDIYNPHLSCFNLTGCNALWDFLLCGTHDQKKVCAYDILKRCLYCTKQLTSFETESKPLKTVKLCLSHAFKTSDRHFCANPHRG